MGWKDALYVDLMPYITNNSFKAAVIRTVGDSTYKARYDELVDVGGKLVDEISIRIKGE